MKKYIFIHYSFVLFFLLSLFVFSEKAHAEISTGTVLFYANHDPNESNTVITNADEQALPLVSGLKLFAGDKIESADDIITILIIQKSLLIEIEPFSTLQFGIKQISKRELVIQVLVKSGSVKLATHSYKHLSQVLYNIQTPKQVLRVDTKEETNEGIDSLYVQLIADDTEITATNILPSSGIFITKPNADIQEIINAFINVARSVSQNKQFLQNPNYEYTPELRATLQFGAFFPELGLTQHVSNTLLLDINYKKFHSLLRIPVLFTGNNQLYDPFGENDYLSIFELDNEEFRNNVSSVEKFNLRMEHLTALFLTKISSMSLTFPQDNFYMYYGDQHLWKNSTNALINKQKTNSLLVHYYQPLDSFKNNLNKEFIMDFNFFYFGNSTRIRHFQAPSLLDSWLSHLELFYNRIWVKPVPFGYPIEIGFTTALDGYLHKYSAKNKNLTSYNNIDSQQYFFYGFDITAPIILTDVFLITSVFEFGQLILSTSKGYIFTKEITNFGAKAGIDYLFVNIEDSFIFGFATNMYYSRGFFQPHLWFAGYEYSIRARIHEAIALLNADAGNKRFLTQIISPEAEFFLEVGEYYTLNIGLLKPISLDNNYSTKELFVAPQFYFETDFVIKKLAGNFDIGFSFNYYNNFLDLEKYTNDFLVNISSIFNELFVESNTVMNSEVYLSIIDTYFISVGMFVTPKYTKTELEFKDNGARHVSILVPYINFSLILF